MRTLGIGLVAAMMMATAANAATSSAQLDALAKQAESNTSYNALLNYQIWSALREPALTLDHVTLSTIGSYTRDVTSALAIKPPNWYAGGNERYVPAYHVACTAMLSFWDPTPPAGLRIEVFSAGVGNCASVLTAAELRAWSWKLKQIGR